MPVTTRGAAKKHHLISTSPTSKSNVKPPRGPVRKKSKKSSAAVVEPVGVTVGGHNNAPRPATKLGETATSKTDEEVFNTPVMLRKVTATKGVKVAPDPTTPQSTSSALTNLEINEFRTPVKSTKIVPAHVIKKDENFPEQLARRIRNVRFPVTSTPKPRAPVAVTQKDVDTCFGFDEQEEENYETLISPIVGFPKTKKFPLPSRSQGKPKPSTSNKVLQNNNFFKEPVVPNKKKTRKGRHAAQKNDQPENNKPIELFGLDDLVSTQSLVKEISTEMLPETDELFLIHDDDGNKGFNSLLAKYGQTDPDDHLDVHFNTSTVKHTYTHQKKLHHNVPVVLNKVPKRRRISKKNHINRVARETREEDNLDAETKKWVENKNKEFEEVLHVHLNVN